MPCVRNPVARGVDRHGLGMALPGAGPRNRLWRGRRRALARLAPRRERSRLRAIDGETLASMADQSVTGLRQLVRPASASVSLARDSARVAIDRWSVPATARANVSDSWSDSPFYLGNWPGIGEAVAASRPYKRKRDAGVRDASAISGEDTGFLQSRRRSAVA